jgi:hypothetical protein
MFVEQKGRVANLDGGGQSSPAGISSTKVLKQFFFGHCWPYDLGTSDHAR